MTIRPAAWSDAARDFLAPAMAGSSHGWEGLAYDAECGRVELFDVLDGKRQVGAFAVRLDEFMFGADLVLVAAGGRLPGVDLTATVVPVVEGWARQAGAARVRIHTVKPGMVRKLQRLGYRAGEIVLAKTVGN